MIQQHKRYRLRTEYNGVEIFDRLEGCVIPAGRSLENYIERAEPVINTPFPKSSEFASAPRRIYWELTRKCNLNCKTCFNREFSSKSELKTETILNLAFKFYNAGVYELRLTGGEPTQHPDFFEIVDRLKEMGFYISMGTNGVYSKELIAKIINAPLDYIIISLDGAVAETHDENRGVGQFKKVLKTLETISSKKCRFRINTLIRKTNYSYEHLKPIAILCDRLHIESLNCIPMRPLTADKSALNLQLNKAEFKEFISGLNRLRTEYKTNFVTTIDLQNTFDNDPLYFKDKSCAAGREGAVVSPYGDIYGCSYSPASAADAPSQLRDRYVAGNLLEKDFLEIWNQKKGWEIYRDLDKYKNESCKQCSWYLERRCIGNCPVMDINNPAAFDPYCYVTTLGV